MISPIVRCAALGLALLCFTAPSLAQITPPRTLSATVDRFATLEELLINRLRATAQDQRSYIGFVVTQVREGRLEISLVVALQRYAVRRSPHFPFPFFERALQFEAAKRGVVLPPVRKFASTKSTPPPSR